MEKVTYSQIEKQLQKLPPEKLTVVYDFVSYLADRNRNQTDTYLTMLASESVLKRDWGSPEEENAWKDL